MITKKMVKIYSKYAGEFEGLQIIGAENENSEIDEKDWNRIDGFINDLELIKKKLVTKTFKTKIYLEIDKAVEQDAILLLNKIASIQL